MKNTTMKQRPHALVVAALTLAALAWGGTPGQAAAPSPSASVNPFVGTAGHGHTYPGATVPFGLVQLSPDTRTEGWDGCSGYHYDDTTIQGFSHTHLMGTGAADLGDILLMPTVGDVHLDVGTPGNGYVSRFSHARETAHPGYYRVYLDDPKVTAELTATARAGFHKYIFPATDSAHIVLDLVHGIGCNVYEAGLTIEGRDTISGYRKTHGWAGDRAVYFVLKFSRPFDAARIEQDGARLAPASHEAKGARLKAFVSYKTAAGEAILVKAGISGTGIDGARRNLAAEIPGWDFDGVRKQAAAQWDRTLGAIAIETPDPHVRATFYSNLYLSSLAPTLFNDTDGTYRGMDRQNHIGAGFQNYTQLSLWDTFRAENPLLTLVQPSRVDDIVHTMAAHYGELGQHALPVWPLWGNETWCMIGYHSIPVITDAYFKGFRHWDAEAVYQAMRDTAMQDRSGLADYKTLGYVASRPGRGATSWTLEYAYDDWCIARMAEALGHKDDARLFYGRGANYRSLFDAATGFMRGRKADGTWRTPFAANRLVNDEYTEADAWQYAFSVQQDVPGLIRLYGGDAPFLRKFDAMLAANSSFHPYLPDITGMIGQYAHGDEQCHHVAYLPAYAGAAWKTQKLVRQVMTTYYDDTPAGQCGNDDCGEMSAWYVFSALGFFPANPASGDYVLGSPVVSRAVLHLDPAYYPTAKGHSFTLVAQNNSPRNVYIQSATLNGKALKRSWFTHADLARGGELRLTMGPKPNSVWGAAPADRPRSGMPKGMALPPVPTPAGPPASPARLTLPARLSAAGAEGFTSDEAYTDGETSKNNAVIDVGAPHAAPATVYQSERYGTPLVYTLPVPPGGPYTVRLHFAELFDAEPGMRIENVSINGTLVLTDFEIFKAAGGLNKAVVKDFPGIRPDKKGNITLLFAATAASPDQNAKVSGIEILAQP